MMSMVRADDVLPPFKMAVFMVDNVEHIRDVSHLFERPVRRDIAPFITPEEMFELENQCIRRHARLMYALRTSEMKMQIEELQRNYKQRVKIMKYHKSVCRGASFWRRSVLKRIQKRREIAMELN